MNDVEFRKMQEAVANMLKCKDEYAKGVFGIYKAFVVAGFTRREAMDLVKATLLGRSNEEEKNR